MDNLETCLGSQLPIYHRVIHRISWPTTLPFNKSNIAVRRATVNHAKHTRVCVGYLEDLISKIIVQAYIGPTQMEV